MNSSLEHARALLSRAEDDLYVVQRLRSDAQAPAWVLGFHAQQSVEKALKAVLTARGYAYPRTHNLVMLVELLRGKGVELPPDADALGHLTPYSVVLRYDDMAIGAPPPADPEMLETVAARTLRWAWAYLNRNQD